MTKEKLQEEPKKTMDWIVRIPRMKVRFEGKENLCTFALISVYYILENARFAGIF